MSEETLIPRKDRADAVPIQHTTPPLASHRPYRPGTWLEAALEKVTKKRGTSYDVAVVDAYLRLFREKGYQLPMAV